MSTWEKPRRRTAVALCLLLLAFGWGAGRALALDTFSGYYGAVFMGMTNAAGPEQHFSYYATYDVDGAGGITGAGYKSVQGGAAPPVLFGISTDYLLFRREGVVLGPGLVAPNRRHGRLGYSLEYGVFTSARDDDEWHVGIIAPRWTAGGLEDSDLSGDYWSMRFSFNSPSGGTDAHLSAFGSETYDGYGEIDGTYTQNVEGGGAGVPVVVHSAYTLAADGTLNRYGSEVGYWLDEGNLLATARVSSDSNWGISLSVKKPLPGTCSLASLQGAYWKAQYRYYHDYSSYHLISLGKVYSDGAGSMTSWTVFNYSDGRISCSADKAEYSVGSNGEFTLGTYIGGVGRDHKVVIASQPNSSSSYGFMILIKQSGLEDATPMCQLLGLNR